MKTRLLLTTVSSVALLFASGALADGGPMPEAPPPPAPAPAAAPAYEPAPPPEYNWYTTIFAGAAFGDDLELDIDDGAFVTDIPLETGYLLGWTLGYDNLFGGDMFKVRPEVELSFRQQDVDLEEALAPLAQIIGPITVDNRSVSTDVLSLMGNVWLDWDLGDLTIYGGGGVGIGWADMPFLLANVESTDFVWQFGGGFNFDVSSRVFLGVGYRYFGGDFEEDITTFFIGPTTNAYKYRTHEVMANLGVRF